MLDESHVFQVLILINSHIVSSDPDRESRGNGAIPIKDDQDQSNEQYQNNVRVTHWGRPHVGGGGDLANTEDTDEVGEGGASQMLEIAEKS